MHIGEHLRPAEKDLLIAMMYHREGSLAWTWEHMKHIYPDVCPPYEIKTQPHKAWQVKSFQVLKKFEDEAVRMIKERIERGTLELCDSQYRNPWFLVGKKDGKFRLINNAQLINAVTI